MNDVLLKQLVEYRRSLCGYIWALTRNTHDTEDIFQDVAAIIIAHAGNDLEVTNFQAWSFEIARRKTLEYFRKNRSGREVLLPGDAMQDFITETYENYGSKVSAVQDRYNALIACMKKLSEKNRTLLQKRFLEDTSCTEIAESFGKTERAIYKAVAKIRMTLLECVQNKLRLAEREF